MSDTNETAINQHEIQTGAVPEMPPVRAEIVSEPILGPQPAPRRHVPAGKGRRAKHVPQRTCVVCREKETKRSLVRIVRTPDGLVEIDPTGKKNGRGAYLCHRRQCWERAVKTPVLARALKIEIGPETLDMLRDHAATITTDDHEQHEATPGKGTS